MDVQDPRRSDSTRFIFLGIAIFGCLTAFIVYSRLHNRSPFLYSWDSVQFALSIEKFDVRLHQPHPPGYILYSLTLRLLTRLISDVNLAFITLNILATIGTCAFIAALIWELTLGQTRTRRLLLSFGGALLFSTNPLSWFYGSVAEIYPVESFFVILICYFLRRSSREPLYLLWSSVLMAVVGGFRPTTEVFLLPCYALFLFRSPRDLVLKSLVLLISLNLCWVVPTMLLSGGPIAYATIVKEQLFNSVRSEVVQQEQRKWFQKEALTVIVLLLQAVTIPITIAILIRIHRLRPTRQELLLLLTVMPVLLFFLFVYFDKNGYLLFIVPVLIALSISVLSRMYVRLGLITALILFGTVLNYRIFMKPPYLGTAEEIDQPGETILTRLTTPNRHMIGGLALRFGDFIQAVSKLGVDRKIFIVKGQYFPDWRLLMYYFPNDLTILVTPGVKRVNVAHQHLAQKVKPPIQIEPEYGIIVAVSSDPPEIPMRTFNVHDRVYYVKKTSQLPKTFSLYSFRFVQERD